MPGIYAITAAHVNIIFSAALAVRAKKAKET